ncbi:MAG TPA: lamin tail domain-containing protein [Nitrososphaera sp.]|nr:lamin tail domain-containing protein [Nitrososphaera sp.]
MPTTSVLPLALSIIFGPFVGMNTSEPVELELLTDTMGDIQIDSIDNEIPFVNATELDGISGLILINEVELNPQGSDFTMEWVELYNPSEVEAYVDGLFINTSMSETIKMPDNQTIDAGETLVVPIGNSSLPNVAEILTLLNSSSNGVVDSTPFLVDTMDSSYTWQRVPDGNENWQFLEESKGYLNDPSAQDTNISASDKTESTNSCLGSAGCVEGVAIRIVDGDTIYVSADGAVYKVELALVKTPDSDNDRFLNTTMFTRTLCLGSPVLVDQDDGQLADDGDVIASVYCSSIGLSEALLDNNLASLDTDQCSLSEFALSKWAQEHGC